MIHSMKNIKVEIGFLAIKMDLKKAYDRHKWSFIVDVL